MKPVNRRIDFRELYDSFNAPVVPMDCGVLCAPHNPEGIPFCCDICHAVPVAYRSEWEYLKRSTRLWKKWRGDECVREPVNPVDLQAQTPPHLCLLACEGPFACEREFRAVSCRQFPFFPYITSDFRFVGITYDWEFTQTCWVISNLSLVTADFRREFVRTFDRIFETWLEDFDSYAELSAETREHYRACRRRIPLLHRNGYDYLISPGSERLNRVPATLFTKFGPYTITIQH